MIERSGRRDGELVDDRKALGMAPTRQLEAWERAFLRLTVRASVARDDLAWLPIHEERLAIFNLIDGRATVAAIIERAGISVPEGLDHVRLLFDLGLITLE